MLPPASAGSGIDSVRVVAYCPQCESTRRNHPARAAYSVRRIPAPAVTMRTQFNSVPPERRRIPAKHGRSSAFGKFATTPFPVYRVDI